MTTDEPPMNEGEKPKLSADDQAGVDDERRRVAREWLQETEAFAQDVARLWPSSRVIH